MVYKKQTSKKKSVNRKRKKINLLNVVPSRDGLVLSSFTEEGNIKLVFPRFRNQWIQKYLIPKRMSSHFTVELEMYGTKIWQLIDGHHTVADIIKQMSIVFKEEPQMEDRVLKYVKQLHKDKFIKLYSSRL